LILTTLDLIKSIVLLPGS